MITNVSTIAVALGISTALIIILISISQRRYKRRLEQMKRESDQKRENYLSEKNPPEYDCPKCGAAVRIGPQQYFVRCGLCWADLVVDHDVERDLTKLIVRTPRGIDHR
jgi:hypothetical protein